MGKSDRARKRANVKRAYKNKMKKREDAAQQKVAKMGYTMGDLEALKKAKEKGEALRSSGDTSSYHKSTKVFADREKEKTGGSKRGRNKLEEEPELRVKRSQVKL